MVDEQITDRIDGFEQSARIVEAFRESVFDEETLTLLTEIAAAIRDHVSSIEPRIPVVAAEYIAL